MAFFKELITLLAIHVGLTLAGFCEPLNINITKLSVSYVCDYVLEGIGAQKSGLVCRERPSEDCVDWSFSGSTSTDLAVMKINTFGLRPDSRDRTVLNVSLSHIGFVKFRYKIQGLEQSNITFCMEINLPEKSNVSSLNFDCYWIGTKDVPAPYRLDYEAEKGSSKEARTFLFNVHSRKQYEEELGEWFPFMYIDRTDYPSLVARWYKAPVELGAPDYTFTVYDSDIEIKSERVQSRNDSDELSLEYTCDMFPRYGNCRAELQVNCHKCKKVESPVIVTGNTARKILIAGIVVFVILISAALLIVCVWKKRSQHYFDVNKLPKVLMLYRPSTQSHIRVVRALAEYFRETCFLVALLDQLDVPRTETKDPFLWYVEAFRQADFIMVISSPPKCCNQGIFKNVDNLALNILTEVLSSCHRPHIFNVTLDYCGKEHIPKETASFHSYRFPRDLDRMLLHIHNNARFPTVIDSVFSFVGPRLHGGRLDLKTSRGRALLDAVKVAENPEIEVCNCKNMTVADSVDFSVCHVPEMIDIEDDSLQIPNSSDAVNTELNKFFVDLENLNLSGEDENAVQPEIRKPNLLSHLKL